MIDSLRVRPGAPPELAARSPEDTLGLALLVDALERPDPKFPDAEPGIESLTVT